MDIAALLQTLFESGLGVDIALCFIVLEFGFLLWRASEGTRKTTALNLLLALGPGACLMLALRCALTGGGVTSVAIWLALSLPLHLTDVARRKF